MSSDQPGGDEPTDSGSAPDENAPGDGQSEADQPPDEDRRRLLVYGGIAALAATGAAGAWAATRPRDQESAPATTTTTTTSTATSTTEEAVGVPARVARYAPDLYFGALEPWFPTDPRQYVVESDGERVVDGFTALEDYTAAYQETGSPPSPTVFYNVATAAPGVDAIQYWLYSVFDQFTVNFHWHDWELLQVFVDRDTGDPLLLSASAHARSIPNNEFLDPALAGGRRPGILAEVGSHSSASQLNARTPTFERLPGADWTADVTNDPLDVARSVATPFAYGLPRGEGARLPFVMPELDGTTLDAHPGLDVDAGAFVDASATVSSWHGLPWPPTDVPLREPGLVLTHPDSATAGDATYDLVPMADVADTVDDFVGPQLRFEFVVPGFAEDLAAGHLTSVGIPWTQPRYTDPLADVTDPHHRQAIDGTTPAGLTNRVVGRIRHLQGGIEGALDGVEQGAKAVLDGIATVSLVPPLVELAVQLASDHPTATVTRDGVFTYLHVDPGAHRLVANGPGYAPLAERFEHDGGTYRAGADGDLTVVANDDTAWIRVDGRDSNGISHVRITEDYAGVVYDGAPPEDDRFAVAVHEAGAYTVDVEDTDGVAGSLRVSPQDLAEGDLVVEGVQTGKYAVVRSLLAAIEDLLALGRRFAERDDAEGAYLERLALAREEAEIALALAERGDAEAANDRLSRTVDRLVAAIEVLGSGDQDGYSDAAVAVLSPKTVDAIRRAERAYGTPVRDGQAG